MRNDLPACKRIVGEHVLRQRGLNGLATDTLQASTQEFNGIFNLLTDPDNYPFHVYCQHGKDRTGLTVVLLLLLLQVPKDAIEVDYMCSASELHLKRNEMVREFHAMSLPDTFADCDPELVNEVEKWLSQFEGGIRGYLEKIGISGLQQEEIGKILLV